MSPECLGLLSHLPTLLQNCLRCQTDISPSGARLLFWKIRHIFEFCPAGCSIVHVLMTVQLDWEPSIRATYLASEISLGTESHLSEETGLCSLFSEETIVISVVFVSVACSLFCTITLKLCRFLKLLEFIGLLDLQSKKGVGKHRGLPVWVSDDCNHWQIM